jgi:hypothetical protein
MAMIQPFSSADIDQMFFEFDRLQFGVSTRASETKQSIAEFQKFLITHGTLPDITLKIGMEYADTMQRWKLFFIDAPKLLPKTRPFMTAGIIQKAANAMLAKLNPNRSSGNIPDSTKGLLDLVFFTHYTRVVMQSGYQRNLDWLRRYRVTTWRKKPPEDLYSYVQERKSLLTMTIDHYDREKWVSVTSAFHPRIVILKLKRLFGRLLGSSKIVENASFSISRIKRKLLSGDIYPTIVRSEDRINRLSLTLQLLVWKVRILLGRILCRLRFSHYGNALLSETHKAMMTLSLREPRRRYYQVMSLSPPETWYRLVGVEWIGE